MLLCQSKCLSELVYFERNSLTLTPPIGWALLLLHDSIADVHSCYMEYLPCETNAFSTPEVILISKDNHYKKYGLEVQLEAFGPDAWSDCSTAS